jgi:hypothetical protein
VYTVSVANGVASVKLSALFFFFFFFFFCMLLLFWC